MKPPIIELNDGNKMPQIGLGLWQVTDQAQFEGSFNEAIKVGYRHFDTAQAYNNEQYLGAAWKKSGLKREDLFITTKIHITHFNPKTLHESYAESLNKLQTEYVDLLLLHFPVTVLRKKAWLALEDIKTSGMAKSIGVSNYTARHLDEMKKYANTMPVINQVELHLFLQQLELQQYCKENNIQVEAYSPIARAHILDNPIVQAIAEKHDRTYVQIMLRWLTEMGIVIIPKSNQPKRVAENFAIFDFELDQEDMKKLEEVDLDKRFCWSPVHVP